MSNLKAAPASLRAENAERTRTRLIEAGLALLQQGAADLTLRAVARQAGIAERTLYRYFETREQYTEALGPRLRELAGAPLPESIDGLPQYAQLLFERFEQNRPLVEGIVASSGARADLRGTRARNLAGMRALVDRGFPEAGEAARAAAASALRVLLSGAGWVYLRSSCGLPNDAVIEHARWTIGALFAGLRADVPACAAARAGPQCDP